MRTSILLLTLALTSPAALAAEPGVAPEATRFPERAECGVNLLNISAALQAFAAAHDGALPSKLSEAFAGAERTELQNLICPAARPRVTEGGFHPSYAYVNITPGGRKLAPDAEDILAFDLAPVHEGGHNVLLTTMRAVYMEEVDFLSALDEQRARWEKLGKKVEIISQDLIPLADGDPLPARPDIDPAANTDRWDAFVASAHFKIAVVVLIAIGFVLLLLVLQSRKTPAGSGGDDEQPPEKEKT